MLNICLTLRVYNIDDLVLIIIYGLTLNFQCNKLYAIPKNKCGKQFNIIGVR